MKKIVLIVAMGVMVAPAWASHWDDNPDMRQDISNDHARHSPHVAGDTHEPERGSGDDYGDLRHDRSKGSHVPHVAGDRHGAETGSGDVFGNPVPGRPK